MLSDLSFDGDAAISEMAKLDATRKRSLSGLRSRAGVGDARGGIRRRSDERQEGHPAGDLTQEEEDDENEETEGEGGWLRGTFPWILRVG